MATNNGHMVACGNNFVRRTQEPNSESILATRGAALRRTGRRQTTSDGWPIRRQLKKEGTRAHGSARVHRGAARTARKRTRYGQAHGTASSAGHVQSICFVEYILACTVDRARPRRRHRNKKQRNLPKDEAGHIPGKGGRNSPVPDTTTCSHRPNVKAQSVAHTSIAEGPRQETLSA